MAELWSGIQSFKRGHIWRVGDGAQINIWEDPWIPSSPTRKLMTPRGNIVITKVYELIDTENRVWDEQLISELFWPIDVQRILNIPLALGMMDDFVSWHHNRSGIFSVRSTYHEEWEHQHGRKLRMTNSIQASSTSPVWSTIWKLNVPSKIKIHVWKALLGSIPCLGVLANRHMITSSHCPFCRLRERKTCPLLMSTGSWSVAHSGSSTFGGRLLYYSTWGRVNTSWSFPVQARPAGFGGGGPTQWTCGHHCMVCVVGAWPLHPWRDPSVPV